MKKAWLIALAPVVIAGFVFIEWSRSRLENRLQIPTPTPTIMSNGQFRLESSVFVADGIIPVEYTCDGENKRSPLSVDGVPEGTKSLAVVMYDPDAPGGTFVHWVAWNIPPETKVLPEGVLPAGIIEGTNSFRSVGYQGPCPPSGTHRYIWRIYALRTVLSLDRTTTREDLETAINTYVITQTELMGRYTKQ